jgi:primosomal protein N' (replication factor Y)
MIADVAFDVPVAHRFSYRVPPGWALRPGQRVAAPLRGAVRVGTVLAVRAGEAAGLVALQRAVDAAPVLDAGALALAEWIAGQSLSSVGAVCAALVPPPAGRADGEVPDVASPAVDVSGVEVPAVEVIVGAGRERRLLQRLGQDTGAALVIVPDVEAAAPWARALGRRGRVARLDSGVRDAERARAWAALARGEGRLAVGTRSALLAPLAAGGALALVDEHEAAHRPPGPPRMHARDVLRERAARERRPLILTAATPSVETWWRADAGHARLVAGPPAPWPALVAADTRGVLRQDPLTGPLARATAESLGAGRRVLLLVSRLASALACDECGAVLRCPTCAIALAWTRAGGALRCRLCATASAAPATCPECRGRRLSPFGWGAERVEHAVRRRFGRARVARYDPEARRGARAAAQREAAHAADVVVGTRGALRLFGPAALGAVGLVSPDQLLRLPDFRAAERLFALLWAAAERVRPDGAVVVQSQTPGHYALEAASRQDLGAFYREEMKFRAELGYPPFRRLAVVTVTAAEPARGETLAAEVVRALAADRDLTVYAPAADRRGRARRVVVKGRGDLPERLAAGLADFRRPRPRRHGMIDVEVDPVEWPS